MKNTLLIIFIYFSFGVTTFSERTLESSGSFKMIIPNVKAMDKEVQKLDLTIVKAAILNSEVDLTLIKLDSLNKALDNPKALREYKEELKKNK
jgi:hypothetical protein